MRTPTEVAFLNMSTPDPTFESFLVRISGAVNEALRNEKQNVREHVEHPPFEFGYIDSTTPNARATSIGGRSFIGITMPLIHALVDTCARLGKSEAVAEVLGVAMTLEGQNAIFALMFQTQLGFVVSHEYTHHVHGHLPRTSGPPFDNKVSDTDEARNLQDQAFEIDADGYAVFHVLAHLLAGEGRLQAIELLRCGHKDSGTQDKLMLSAFVMAIGAFLFVWPPAVIDSPTIYRLEHPPQAVRMDFIMRNAIRWSRQNKPALESWLTPDTFQMLMRIAAGATWGMNGGKDWSEQTNFVKSESGSEYLEKLGAMVDDHIQSL